MRRLALLLCSLALPFLLAAFGLRLLASGPFLSMVYGRPGFPESAGFSEEERMALALPSTRFILNETPPAELAALEHQGQPLYTADEIQHLVDVRMVVTQLGRVALASALLVLATGLLAWRGGWLASWAIALSRGGWLTLGAMLLLVPAVALFFDAAFTAFHELLFEPGTWQFTYDSGLIRLFPEQFWYDSALVACGYLVVGALVVGLLGRRLARRVERP